MTECYRPRRAPEHRRLELRGLSHHLTRWRGEDPEPLVLLHGFLDAGDTFQFLVDALAPRWTCVAADWRGFGRSDWPAEGYWFPDYLADLDALLDSLSPEAPATLIGHSMGGNIATLFAGLRPERVRRVVCIEGFGLQRTQPGQAPGRMREWLRQLREPAAFTEFPSFEEFARMLRRRNPRLTEARAAFIARSWAREEAPGRVRVRSDPRHKHVNPVLYRRDEAEAFWREIQAPVLYVIAGDSEFLARLGADAAPGHMATLVRDLRPAVVEGASHMVHHEQPERLAALIEDFLAVT